MMKMNSNKKNRLSGYSLIELIVAVAILGVILAGVFYSFSVQNEKYIVVDQVTDAQQSLRGVAEMIERDVRRSGFMVPLATSACAHDYNNQPDVLFVSETEAISTIDVLAEDATDLLIGDNGIPVTGFTSNSVSVGNAAGGGPQLKIDDLAPGGLVENGGVILVDLYDAEQRVACGEILRINGNTLDVDFGPSAFATSIGTRNVVAIPAVVYKILPETTNTPSQLLRNGLVLAYDVEDMQTVFYFDSNADANIDDATEVFGTLNAAGEYPPATGAGFDMSSIREVTINVVTVTQDEAPNTTGGDQDLTSGLAIANRNTGLAPPDRRTRRVHVANIRLRNLGDAEWPS